MAKAGRIAAQVLDGLVKSALTGTSTIQLDRLAERLIKEAGGEPGFKRVPRYYHSICTSINEEVVHGIPTERKLKRGDVLSIDLGVYYHGFHSDTATTIGIGEVGGKVEKFLEVGRRALRHAIAQARVGNRIGDISSVIEETLRAGGYGIVASLAGHGVGRELHEDPLVPNLGQPGSGEELKEGLVLAIEPIYTNGSPAIYLEADGWTVTSEKATLAGQFEHTVAITVKGPIILTLEKQGASDGLTSRE